MLNYVHFHTTLTNLEMEHDLNILKVPWPYLPVGFFHWPYFMLWLQNPAIILGSSLLPCLFISFVSLATPNFSMVGKSFL